MTKTTKTVYVTSDKQEWTDESKAQSHEIELLIPLQSDPCGWSGNQVADFVVQHKDAILSILGAKRRTRSDKGKSRKSKEMKVAA